jgi:hypothetical protein
MKRFVATLAVSAALSLMGAAAALAQQGAAGAGQEPATEELSKGGCESFTWDVSHELAVLEKPAKPVTAATDAKKAAPLDLDQRYAVKLAPQGSVRFAAKPSKPAVAEGSQGGVLSFHTPKAGRYRVSLTTGHWLDVVDGGNFVVSREFQGQRGCEKVHKIVEFELSGNKDFLLQLSGGTELNVGIAITPVKPN